MSANAIGSAKKYDLTQMAVCALNDMLKYWKYYGTMPVRFRILILKRGRYQNEEKIYFITHNMHIRN